MGRAAALRSDEAVVDLALARGVLYTLLASLFDRPSAAGLSRLAAAEAWPAVMAAARLLGRAAGDAGALVRAAGELARAPLESVEAAAERYDRLFGHTARGAVCLFETEYGFDQPSLQPHALADLSGWYRAFGFEPRARERADHVGCECDFMAVLCLKEARLRASLIHSNSEAVDRETLEAACQAQPRFLREHLARVARALAAALRAADGEGFYGRAARLLERVIEADCRRLGIQPGPPTLELRPVAEDDTPMACGSACGTADELIQIQGLHGR